MASNQLKLNEPNDIDGDAKVALLTGITGQVNKILENEKKIVLLIVAMMLKNDKIDFGYSFRMVRIWLNFCWKRDTPCTESYVEPAHLIRAASSTCTPIAAAIAKGE